MYRYQENTFTTMKCDTISTRPVSSLSSGSADSGIFFSAVTTASSATPVSVAAVTNSDDINNLQHQRAHLLAVNAQLRKEIEQVRSAASSTSLESLQQQPEPFLFESQNFQNGRMSSCGKKSPKPDSYKTVMCQAWLSSKICQFAENCRFAHGETELRPSRIQPKQNNKYKTKLCDKYTSSGLCPYGKRCHFIHPDNGNNSYIRPDKLIEVSQRHALADLCLPQQQPDRPVTPSDLAPLAGLPPSNALVPLGPTPSRSSSAAHLRPHPSWPLEPATFFHKKNEEEPFAQTSLFGTDVLTPARISLVSSGFASGDSSPADVSIFPTDSVSPFSTASSSQEINQQPLMFSSDDDDRDFEFFKISGLDNLAEEVTRNLELW